MSTPKNVRSTFDFAVIGSGAAGIHAAVQAAKLNKKVCIIEKVPGKVGGSWIHTGTLPSKTLREVLDTINSIRAHAGIEWVDRIVDDLHTGKLLSRASEVTSQEQDLVANFIKSNKIEIIYGYGVVENRNQVRINTVQQESYIVDAEFILVATGSSPRRPPEIPFDGWRIVDSDDILCLQQIPRSMAIYGAGVVGCEYACIFKAMGVDITVVDSRSRILQYLDRELGDELQKTMEYLGVKFLLDEPLQKISVDGPKAIIELKSTTITKDVLFFAAGRVSNTFKIGLERLGVEINSRGAIVVNKKFQTSVSNIYAAGDAIGPPALAATGFHQGRFVACHAFGSPIEDFPTVFPIGVYTIPELSMVGATEEELKEQKIDYVVGRASYREIARGYIRGDSHGLLKILISKDTHKILGIHIVGADACNLIHIGQSYMQKGGHAQDFINMIFNYPTLAEGYRIAAFNALNKIFKDGVILPPPQANSKLVSRKKA